MKKSLLFLVVVVMALSLVLVACGDQSTDAPAAANGTQNLTMATGGTSGTYYAFGGVLAQAINNADVGLNVNVNSTGASAENIQLIGAGEVQLAILQNDVLDYAYNGNNTWEGKDVITNVAVLGCLYPEICQLIVTGDSGIESVADLAGKSISIGDIGSGVETNAKQILAAYGLTVDDIKAEHLGFSDSAEAVKNRSIDGFFVTAGIPNTAVMDLATSREIKLIAIDGEQMASLMDQYSFYAQASITADDYSFLTEPVTTIAVQATLVCPSDLSEDAAYNVVKAIFDNAETITEGHAKGAYLDPAYALQGISIPLHPGAEKYYKEVGVLAE